MRISRQNLIQAAWLTGLFLLTCNAPLYAHEQNKSSMSDEQRQWIVKSIEEIHDMNIARHVPAQPNLQKFISRDVNAFFRKKFRGSQTTFEFLKKAPTQTGVGFPHFYLWVIVKRKNRWIAQGAINVCAMDKKVFYVTDYLSDSEIRANPDLPGTVFPDSICQKIIQKAFMHLI